MVTRTIDIPVPGSDQPCDSFVAYPDENGRYPAVLLLMDAFGPRHYLYEMARTLAERGYYVLVPNLFFRKRRAPVIDDEFPITPDRAPAAFKKIMALVGEYDWDAGIRDAGAFLDFLAAQKQVRPGPAGLTGYCMGGNMAFRIAEAYPDRIAAVASFHAGSLVDDEPDSPHRLLERIRAEVYVAHADQDDHMTAEQIGIFNAALKTAGVRHEAEKYDGARHGFTMKDLPPYNEEALKRHWMKLPALLGRALAPPTQERGPSPSPTPRL